MKGKYNMNTKQNLFTAGRRNRRNSGRSVHVWNLRKRRKNNEQRSNYQTQEDKVTTQTATLKGSFYERACDGNFETQVDESNLLTEHTDAAAAIKNWFGKVQEPTEAA